MNGPRWLRDEPLDLRKDDQFGVNELVDRLVDLLARAKPPFTLSLSGAWGVGKSTVADAIVARLKERKVRAVKVDAWTQDVNELRRSVVIEVGAALKSGSNEDRKALAEEVDKARATQVEVQSARIEGRELWPTIRQILRSWFAYLTLAAILGVAWYQANALDKDSGLRPIFIGLAIFVTPILVTAVLLKVVTPSTSRAPASQEFALATKFEEVVTKRAGLFGYKGPVVVVVDNLDRLSGVDALTALSQIRALVEIAESRCVFFIPIDRTRLSAHLGYELNDPQAAADYLEKFFNLDLQLAQPEPIDLHDWAFGEASKLFPEAAEPDRRSLAEIAVSAAVRSPRTVTRILNGTFTRYEALRPTDAIGLRQLVLVEGLLTIAPELANRLAEEPRAFVQARQQFNERNEMAWQAAALGRYLGNRTQGSPSGEAEDETEEPKGDRGFDPERLRKFLAANSDITLSREQLRLALTLREDRFWKGVTEADTLKDALESGDAAAFTAALAGRSAQERAIAIARTTQLVIDSVAYRRVVARAVDAAAVEVQADDDLARRLHGATVLALGDAEPELLASLTRSSVEFVFGQRREASGLHKVRRALVAAMTGETAQDITSLVFAARLVADLLDSDDLAVTRDRLATATLDEQAPIFEEPPNRLLAEGPVATVMFDSLGKWVPGAAGQEQTVLRAERLVALSKVGWDGRQTQLTALATRLLPQIPELTPEAQVLASLDALTRLFAVADASADFDQFGTQLAARQTVGDQEVFRYVLRLPMQPVALSAVGAQIQTWMQASTPPQVAPLLDLARERVEEALPTYRQLLLDLWESKGEVAYAALAVGGDSTRLGELGTKWAALPPTTCLQNAVEALELTAAVGDRAAVEALIALVVARIPVIPFGSFTALPAVAQWLVRHSFERRSLTIAVEARVRAAASPSEAQAIAAATIVAADEFGGRQRAGLAEALAESFVNLNIGEPDQVGWLVERLTAHNTRERLVVQLIERGLTLEPTLDAVSHSRAHFDSSQVYDALASRGSRETDVADARADLAAMAAWTRPPTSAGSDARASLEAVGVKFEELRDQAERLMPREASNE
jgi:hypothetical protein